MKLHVDSNQQFQIDAVNAIVDHNLPRNARSKLEYRQYVTLPFYNQVYQSRLKKVHRQFHPRA